MLSVAACHIAWLCPECGDVDRWPDEQAGEQTRLRAHAADRRVSDTECSRATHWQGGSRDDSLLQETLG
jgi:hypothetical protein